MLGVANRVGLGHLAGFDRPAWSPRSSTVVSSRLGPTLAAAGLGAHRVLACFPDHLLPSVIATEELFELDDGPIVVDQLVASPVGAHEGSSAGAPRTRQLLADLVEAGVGVQAANGLLVGAARSPNALDDRVDRNTLAWRTTPGRRRRFRRTLRVVSGVGGLVVRRSAGASGEVEGWLTQTTTTQQPFVEGANLAQLASAADDVGLERLLRRWRDLLATLERPHDPSSTSHPYRPAGTETVLPAEYLDAGLDNFVELAGSAELVFVDSEWHAAGGVDVGLTVTRALWKLAQVVDLAGGDSVDRRCQVMAVMVGLDLDERGLDRWRRAEAGFLHVVTGRPLDELERELSTVGGRADDRGRREVDAEAASLRRRLDEAERETGPAYGRRTRPWPPGSSRSARWLRFGWPGACGTWRLDARTAPSPSGRPGPRRGRGRPRRRPRTRPRREPRWRRTDLGARPVAPRRSDRRGTGMPRTTSSRSRAGPTSSTSAGVTPQVSTSVKSRRPGTSNSSTSS